MNKPLAPTPPMGWNSWNTFGSDINETVIRETADALISTGLKDAGYEYVVIDDCWSVRDERDDKGNLGYYFDFSRIYWVRSESDTKPEKRGWTINNLPLK